MESGVKKWTLSFSFNTFTDSVEQSLSVFSYRIVPRSLSSLLFSLILLDAAFLSLNFFFLSASLVFLN